MVINGINLHDFKYRVVDPVLTLISLNSAAATNLIVGTALAESMAGANGLVQEGGGPALSLLQEEPATINDIDVNFLSGHPALRAAVMSLMAPGMQQELQFISNLAVSVAYARIKYLRSPLKLPAFNDASGLASYHKEVYNSSAGKANPTQNVPLFQTAIST